VLRHGITETSFASRDARRYMNCTGREQRAAVVSVSPAGSPDLSDRKLQQRRPDTPLSGRFFLAQATPGWSIPQIRLHGMARRFR
jgi:hypothetical protein